MDISVHTVMNPTASVPPVREQGKQTEEDLPMNDRTMELIEFIGTLPGVRLTYHPRRKDYEVAFKESGRLLDGWSVINKVKFFYETIKLEKFDINAYSFHVLGNKCYIFLPKEN
jgi:hypothetical protein